VPDNVADKVATSWRNGNVGASIADYRTEKDVRPMHLGGDAVHFLFPLTEAGCPHLEVLSAAARSITHLGWGVDMVVGDAKLISAEETDKLSGERWRPAEGAATISLRVPKGGTLSDLAAKHEAFLNRLSSDGFKPVPPLSAYRIVGYRRATDPVGRAWAAFSILKPDASGNVSFDTARRCRDVAAWLRCATSQVCREWPDVASFVHGHDPNDNAKQLRGPKADERFMYLPLPTINFTLGRVESIRRVLIAAPDAFRERVEWVRRRLAGQDLVGLDGEVKGLLNILPTSDWVLRRYVGTSMDWSTVTPVIWSGFDAGDAAKAERILRRAFIDAGLPRELVEKAELEWRAVGFRRGVDPATKYCRPDKLHGRRFHVRVRFPHAIAGPLAVGAGRYRGLGVFAIDDSR
jgi:CRISPR-associated protein Csb2